MSAENSGDAFEGAEEVAMPASGSHDSISDMEPKRTLGERLLAWHLKRADQYTRLKQHKHQTEQVWIQQGYALRAAAEVGNLRPLKRVSAYLALRTVMEWNLFWLGVRFLEVAIVQTPIRTAAAFHRDPWIYVRDKIISLTVVVIVSLEAVSVLSLSGFSLLPNAEAESNEDHPPPPPPPASGTDDSTASALTLFPADRRAYTWKRGSLSELRIGYDQKPVALSGVTFGGEICAAPIVVAVGSASLEGSSEVNRRYSRLRAEALGKKIQEGSSRCAARPAVFLVALWEPADAWADGTQRRVLVLAPGMTLSSLRSPQWTELLSDLVDPALATAPRDFDSHEICALDAKGECVWKATL